MGEDVSHAAHGLDVVAAIVGVAELFADLADVHIDAAVEGGKLAAEHYIDEVLAGHDASRFAQQNVQEIEFHGGQLYRFAILADDACGRIKFNIADQDHIG